MSFAVFSKPKYRWWLSLGIGAIALTGSTAFYVISQTSKPQPTTISAPQPARIAALGRLEPASEVIKLAAPVSLDGDRILELRVKQGDRVTAGQIVAVLDSRDRLQDAVQQAQEQVKIAEAKLAQVQAGAKTGEIQSQQAAIARLQAEREGELAAQSADLDRLRAEVRNARSEFQRFEQLYREGGVSASNLESKRLVLDTAQAQLNQAQAKRSQSNSTLDAQIQEAQATLDRIAEVRPVDVRAAQTEVSNAKSAVQRSQTELDKAYIRAPIAAQILKIHTRAGEKVKETGIVDLAQTQQMMAIAEVYQSDISKIRVGQAATVTGQAFEGELKGAIAEVGMQVNRQNVFSNQPGENLDRRIVEVKIQLSPEDSKRVATLTNLQIQAAILLD
jgi:HlyD family secretion protein